MIQRRDGYNVTLCDSCYRVKMADGEGWASELAPPRPGDALQLGAEPARVDLCPACQPKGNAA